MPDLHHPRAWSRRAMPLLMAIALSLLVVSTHPLTAAAVPSLEATSTTTHSVPPNATTALAGVSVSGLLADSDIEVTVSTDRGTLGISETTGLTLGYGNHWTGDPSIFFHGARTDVQAALDTLEITTGNDAGTIAKVGITALPSSPGYIYSPSNGHFYSFVADTGVNWSDSRTAAAGTTFLGQQGYLASIPNAAVNDLISSRIEGATNVWFGASSDDAFTSSPPRTWTWSDGPLAGDPVSYCSTEDGACDFVNNDGLYNSWAAGEPNNCCGSRDGNNDLIPHSGEWVPVTNWSGTSGQWNDISDVSGLTSGYVVEYGDQANGSTGFSDLVSDSSDVLIPAVPTAPTAPRDLAVTPGDRTLTLTFSPPTSDGGSAVTHYQVSTNDGHSWKTYATTGTSTRRIVVVGVRNRKTYQVQVRAVSDGGTGTASASVPVTTASWFSDPVSTRDRAREVAVPKHPGRYSGSAENTRATYRSKNGTTAYPSARLAERQLQSGEAVNLTSLFKPTTATLSTSGRARLKSMAKSLKYVDVISCEGYTDYSGKAANRKKVGLARATTVCAALKGYAGQLSSATPASYGGSRPVVIGPKSARGANRRVVVLIRK